MNLNRAFILGNVTRDPESKALPSGQQVVNFGMATNRFYNDQQGQRQQDTEFHNVVAFGKLADTIARYVNKGSLILIEGRIKTRSWQNPQTGAKQYRTEIIAENLQLGPRPAGSQGGGTNSGNREFSRPFGQQGQKSAPTEDIPVIEENQPPQADFASNEAPQEGEIDVKNIPF